MFGIDHSGWSTWLKAQLGWPVVTVPAVERRQTVRPATRYEAQVHTSTGRFAVIGVDFHERGALILSKMAWPAGTVVFIDIKSFWKMGFAEVRHCRLRSDGTYALGLQFHAPLMQQEVGTWRIERIKLPMEPEAQREAVYIPPVEYRKAA